MTVRIAMWSGPRTLSTATMRAWENRPDTVVVGPYRYVRNPMYLAVLAIILGQALLFGSWGALLYAGSVLLAVVLFVLGYEEPTLESEYGDGYRDYRRNVRGWIPRVRPWNEAT